MWHDLPFFMTMVMLLRSGHACTCTIKNDDVVMVVVVVEKEEEEEAVMMTMMNRPQPNHTLTFKACSTLQNSHPIMSFSSFSSTTTKPSAAVAMAIKQPLLSQIQMKIGSKNWAGKGLTCAEQ